MAERFELISQLGKGAMGVVWRARDTFTGEIVALKVLHGIYADDPEYIRRFEREIEVARRINSPHVVEVKGFGTANGVPYIAMELIEGPSLRDLLRSHGPFDWPDVRAFAQQATEGLAAAHRSGVIHRDIKPGNLLFGADGYLKIVDFGIARATDLTQIGDGMVGTPNYMAPEGQVDERSDFYSLGCVLYELLTGRAVFTGGNQREILMQHLSAAPDLSLIEDRKARAVIGYLLEKDPRRRPQNADQLLRVLEGRKLRRRRKGIPTVVKVAAAVFVGLGVVGGGVAVAIAAGLRAPNLAAVSDALPPLKPATSTPTPPPPTATTTAMPSPYFTPTATPTRVVGISAGATARVINSDANPPTNDNCLAVRTVPKRDMDNLIARICTGTNVIVLEGPTNDGTFMWWRVSYPGGTGWVAERRTDDVGERWLVVPVR